VALGIGDGVDPSPALHLGPELHPARELVVDFAQIVKVLDNLQDRVLVRAEVILPRYCDSSYLRHACTRSGGILCRVNQNNMEPDAATAHLARHSSAASGGVWLGEGSGGGPCSGAGSSARADAPVPPRTGGARETRWHQ